MHQLEFLSDGLISLVDNILDEHHGVAKQIIRAHAIVVCARLWDLIGNKSFVLPNTRTPSLAVFGASTGK